MSIKPSFFSLKILALYKACLGIGEVVVGIALFVAGRVANGYRFSFLEKVVAEELQEDPQDRFAHWILSQEQGANIHALIGLGGFVAILGVVKIIVALGLWYQSRRLYALLLVLLSATSLFALYELFRDFSWSLAILLGFDLMILFYVFRIFSASVPSESTVVPSPQSDEPTLK